MTQASAQLPDLGPHNMHEYVDNYINPALVALLTNSAGPSAPANGRGGAAEPWQFWIDTSTTPAILKVRVGAAWVSIGSLSPKADLDSPALTGTPTGPTAPEGDFSAQLANTAFVGRAVLNKAPIVSPNFVGTPTSPTAAKGDFSTELANTAFTQSAILDQLAPFAQHDKKTPIFYTNYILHSNDLAGGWFNINGAVTATVVAGPNGHSLAKLVDGNAANGFHGLFAVPLPTFAKNGTYTFSVYAKAAERSQLVLWVVNGSDPVRAALFDLVTKTAIVQTAGLAQGAVPSIEEQDDLPGVLRCSITFTLDSDGSPTAYVLQAIAGAYSYTGVTSGLPGIFVGCAQWTEGSVQRSYAETVGSAVAAVENDLVALDGRERFYLPNNRGGVPVGLGVSTESEVLYIVAIGSQSNAAGSGTDALIATAPLFSGAALASPFGPHADGFRFDGPLIDLVESVDPVAGYRETACSGWLNTLLSKLNTDASRQPKFAAFDHAIGAQTYQMLKRGGVSYNNFLCALADIADSARRRHGLRPVFLAYDWQGNESNVDEPGEYWARYMLQNYRQMDEDIRRITQQHENWIYVLDYERMPSTIANANGVFIGNRTAAGQNPNIILGNPTYQRETLAGTEIHMTNVGQNKRGQALGRAVYSEVFGSGWLPFMDRRVFRSGSAQIAVDFQFPAMATNGLVLDTSNAVVSSTGFPTGNYFGFRFDDLSGSSPVITGHTISGRRIYFTLSGAPATHWGILSYACERNAGETRDGPTYGARGCLRSDLAYPLLYGLGTDYDWCLPFITELPL